MNLSMGHSALDAESIPYNRPSGFSKKFLFPLEIQQQSAMMLFYAFSGYPERRIAKMQFL
jgi:hypothetical protein